jgi:hypothetical protein
MPRACPVELHARRYRQEPQNFTRCHGASPWYLGGSRRSDCSSEREDSTGQARGIWVEVEGRIGSSEREDSTGQARGIRVEVECRFCSSEREESMGQARGIWRTSVNRHRIWYILFGVLQRFGS